jgi:type IV pilus assembly protein PilE
MNIKIRKSSGFTLVELMIVVVIVGILTAVSMNFYGDYVIDANRTDGRSALTSAAASLEKCKALNSTYVGCAIPATSNEGLYTIAEAAADVRTASTFKLTATPVVGTAQENDGDCLTMTFASTGLKDGTGANSSDCW